MEKKKEKTFEERFEMLMTSFEKLRESQAETAKSMQELSTESTKTEKAIQALKEEVTGIAKSNGMVAEETIFNSLNKDMIFGGVKFDEIERNIKLKSKMLNLQGEYDIVLTNGDTIAIIEAKWRVRPEDITKLATKQVANFRNLFPMFADYKIMLGIGGMGFEGDAEDIAKASGVGVIKVIGNKAEYYTEGIRLY